MIPEIYSSTGSDDSIDVEFHYEIKCRAYELYEGRHDAVDCDDIRARTVPRGLCSFPDSEELQW